MARFFNVKSTYARWDHIVRKNNYPFCVLRSEFCLVSGIYPPESGGPAKFTKEFAEWYSTKSGHCSVVTLTDEKSSTTHNAHQKIIKLSRSLNIVMRYLKVAFTIRRNSSSDVPILAAGMFLETYLATRFSRRKYVAKVPGDFVWERARNNGYTELDIEDFQSAALNLKYRVFRWMASQSLRSASQVIVPTRQLEKLCVRWGVNAENISYIPNSVDLSLFNSTGKPTKDFDLLTVCRLVKWKGVDELIAVAHALNLKLAIAGDGPEKLNLENQAKKIGAGVTFFGDISQPQLIDLYQRSRIFVLNSSYEGLSHALLEARASGLFSIARANTGSEDVIENDNDGILCGSHKYPDLKSAITYVLSHPEFEHSCISHSLARTSEIFDKKSNFEKIYQLLKAVA